MMTIKEMFINIGAFGIILSFLNLSYLNAGPLDSYGYRSENEIKKHRKLEGVKVDKKHEIYSKDVKAKVNKILNKKGNIRNSSISANINRTKSKVNNTLNHKRTSAYKKSIRKQNALTKYDLSKLKSVVNKNRSSVSNKAKASLMKTSTTKKVIPRNKSKTYSKKKRVRKTRTTKRTTYRR